MKRLVDDARAGIETAVSIEIIDDVAFSPVEGNALEVVQTKHHAKKLGALTDASGDLWSTLRVWIDSGVAVESAFPTAYFIVTTAPPPSGSAAATLLGATGRDVSAAEAILTTVALTSKSESNKLAYQAWNALEQPQRISLLERVTVLHSSADIQAIRLELEAALSLATARVHLSTFTDYLEGWWFKRAVDQLVAGQGLAADTRMLEGELDELRLQFSSRGLPIAAEIATTEVTEAILEDFDESVFVSQMRLVGANEQRIANAIRDYLRAYTQRSRWLREELLFADELEDYERRLVESWEKCFFALVDELEADATEKIKSAMGRKVLTWAESVDLSLREFIREPFVAQGSLHMLADDAAVGWHPEFRELLVAAIKEPGK